MKALSLHNNTQDLRIPFARVLRSFLGISFLVDVLNDATSEMHTPLPHACIDLPHGQLRRQTCRNRGSGETVVICAAARIVHDACRACRSAHRQNSLDLRASNSRTGVCAQTQEHLSNHHHIAFKGVTTRLTTRKMFVAYCYTENRFLIDSTNTVVRRLCRVMSQ